MILYTFDAFLLRLPDIPNSVSIQKWYPEGVTHLISLKCLEQVVDRLCHFLYTTRFSAVMGGELFFGDVTNHLVITEVVYFTLFKLTALGHGALGNSRSSCSIEIHIGRDVPRTHHTMDGTRWCNPKQGAS